ncbi:MAG: hypothetical protein II518_04510 [Candidatus Methanomethylophilus sp.]|nr:hypothetical protein [Methanomethylophilus sp.]
MATFFRMKPKGVLFVIFTHEEAVEMGLELECSSCGRPLWHDVILALKGPNGKTAVLCDACMRKWAEKDVKTKGFFLKKDYYHEYIQSGKEVAWMDKMINHCRRRGVRINEFVCE